MVEVEKILSWARVADTSDAKARAARTLGFSDFEDALQAVSALACAADCIITRNTRDFGKSNIPALTPSAFLEHLASS
jgi:hypothetical protein